MSEAVMIAHNLPSQPTPFIGRAEEIAEISRILDDPACRLLTLVGPGGIGKTRLAIEAARQLVGEGLKPSPTFYDGVHFVPLQPLTSPDFIIAAIADALNFSFYGEQDPKSQLLHFLREQCLLLIMDNFEHLLEGTGLLTDMLEAAPAVKILATSRERLNVQEEWALALEGLSFPESQTTDPIEGYSAVQLFVQRARRVHTHFSLNENAESVIAICQQVEGMPLGLELAATWLRAMSCEQIAAQMERSFEVLTTPLRNVPERHRSLRAVFEHSWALLSETERGVLARLSIFRGGFDLESAEQVAGASLAVLGSLADKSLIRVNPSGRYDLHELMRQFASDRLEDVGEASATAHRHLAYFLKLAEQAEAHLYGREQVAWYDRLEVELDNVRGALAWSARGGEAVMGLRLAAALGWFFEHRSHSHEGLECLERLLALAREALPLVQVKALHRAAELAAVNGAVRQARALGQEALALAREAHDQWNIAWSHASLARAESYTIEPGAYISRVAHQEESLALFRGLEDSWGISHLLRRRAITAIEQADYSYARVLLEEALTLAREVDNKNATAWALYLLGFVSWHENSDLRQIKTLCQESLSLFRETRELAGVGDVLIFMAGIERSMGNYTRSQMLYEELLALLREIRVSQFEVVLFALCLAGLGSLAAVRGGLEGAAILMGAAAKHVSVDDFAYWEKGFAIVFPFDSDVAMVRARLGDTAFAGAWAVGQAMTRAQAIAYALQGNQPESETSPPRITDQSLIEPLTERELDVLRLMAVGLSNPQIAEQLVIATGTVKAHTNSIFGKLGVANRVQAVNRAKELHLL